MLLIERKAITCVSNYAEGKEVDVDMEKVTETATKKLIRSKSGLKIVAANEDLRSPFVMCEPEWTPDKEVTNCTKCNAKFGFTTRKHHCRRCGQIYCSSCCDERLELLRMCFIDPVRVCHDCAPATVEENKFFDRHLKMLTAGATFRLGNTDSIIESQDEMLQCKLSANHRHLMFDGVKLGPLDLNSIRALHVDKESTTGMKSIEIVYNETNTGKNGTVKLLTSPDLQHHKTGSLWISAMQQAFKLMYDCRVEG